MIQYQHIFATQGDNIQHICPICGHKIYVYQRYKYAYYPILSATCRFCKKFGIAVHYTKLTDNGGNNEQNITTLR